jgi:translation initiation factor IF-2
VGDNVIAGTSYGRIKAMFNERNQRIDLANLPNRQSSWDLTERLLPVTHSTCLTQNRRLAKSLTSVMQLQREQGLRTQKRLTLSDISHRIALGSFKELNIIVKGDTDGSIEALSDSFIKLSTEKIKVDVIYKAVGQISESDVTLADASPMPSSSASRFVLPAAARKSG